MRKIFISILFVLLTSLCVNAQQDKKELRHVVLFGGETVYVAAYCEHLQDWLTHVGSVNRKEGSFILDAEPFTGFRAHVYLGFISDLWNDSSKSEYLGEIDVL